VTCGPSVDGRKDQDDARPFGLWQDAAQSKYNSSFVFPEDLDRSHSVNDENNHYDHPNVDYVIPPQSR